MGGLYNFGLKKLNYLEFSDIICIFAPNPSFCIRGSLTDSCGIVYYKHHICMIDENDGIRPCPNDETNALIERDENSITWVYKGKEHGYDSWYGIPPESL